MLIDEIARAAGLEPDDYEPYGRDKAKLAIGLAER
jgi:formyltetrahydrofolate synthetase